MIVEFTSISVNRWRKITPGGVKLALTTNRRNRKIRRPRRRIRRRNRKIRRRRNRANVRNKRKNDRKVVRDRKEKAKNGIERRNVEIRGADPDRASADGVHGTNRDRDRDPEIATVDEKNAKKIFIIFIAKPP